MESRYRLTEWCVWLSLSAMFAVFVGLHIWSLEAGVLRHVSFGYYGALALAPFKAILFGIIGPYLVARFVRATWSAMNTERWRKDIRSYLVQTFSQRTIRGIFDEVICIARVLVPGILTLVVLTSVLDILNVVNASRLVDLKVLKWDVALTGTYPFIAWSTPLFPGWFMKAVIFCFDWLAITTLMFAFYLLYSRRRLFYEFIAAFSLSLIVMLPFWEMMPVLSPHDRFIDNVYDLPVPDDISAELRTHEPDPDIAQFLKTMRESKTKGLGGHYPTSTIPSAHVAWGVLLAYYAYHSRNPFLLPLCVLAVLSTMGTFLLAQHYFVDMIGGILVGIFVIAVVRRLSRLDRKRGFPDEAYRLVDDVGEGA